VSQKFMSTKTDSIAHMPSTWGGSAGNSSLQPTSGLPEDRACQCTPEPCNNNLDAFVFLFNLWS
jgi:hypothetical protein